MNNYNNNESENQEQLQSGVDKANVSKIITKRNSQQIVGHKFSKITNIHSITVY